MTGDQNLAHIIIHFHMNIPHTPWTPKKLYLLMDVMEAIHPNLTLKNIPLLMQPILELLTL